MPKVKVIQNKGTTSEMPEALSAESRIERIAGKAMDLVEARIDAGTASSQEVCWFLKTVSLREKMEIKKMEKDIALAEAKKNDLESTQRIEELYKQAMAALSDYKGNNDGGRNDGFNS